MLLVGAGGRTCRWREERGEGAASALLASLDRDEQGCAGSGSGQSSELGSDEQGEDEPLQEMTALRGGWDRRRRLTLLSHAHIWTTPCSTTSRGGQEVGCVLVLSSSSHSLHIPTSTWLLHEAIAGPTPRTSLPAVVSTSSLPLLRSAPPARARPRSLCLDGARPRPLPAGAVPADVQHQGRAMHACQSAARRGGEEGPTTATGTAAPPRPRPSRSSSVLRAAHRLPTPAALR